MTESMLHIRVPRELVEMAKQEGIVTKRVVEEFLNQYLESFKAHKEAFLNKIEIPV